ncbi:MAG: zinc metalloprotease, partial [Caldilineaceae bacterium]
MSKKSAPKEEAAMPAPTRRTCGTMRNHERLLRTVPGYRQARDVSENYALRAVRWPQAGRVGITTIPVVVHVVYNTDLQNISDSQIYSQIDVLNADFRKKNADISAVPPVFAPLVDDARIEFELATIDPSGNPTSGITRTVTEVSEFDADDSIKSTTTGGADAWPSDKYLNIWVAPNLYTIDQGQKVYLLGYAQFPGGPAVTDGVVILHSAFGTTGTAIAPFNLGRTTTHEIGHWLNLRHIWGDDGSGCSGSDFVADTPNQGGENYGKPTFPRISCGNAPNGDMFMNYMDYVDDDSMMMFTREQIIRMQATLDSARSLLGKTIIDGNILPKENFKEWTKEQIKDNPKDLIKDNLKDSPKENPKDLPKDNPKDWIKE